MAKKRKSDVTRLDEVDRAMYTTFCSAANSLSQLYSQAMNHQRLSFQGGERHALEKLYQRILRQQEEGSQVTTIDIVAYLQNELEYGAEEPPVSPRLPIRHEHPQSGLHNLGIPMASIPWMPSAAGPGIRCGQPDHQVKNSVFSNALSSPVGHSLQQYQLSQGGYQMSSGNGSRNRDTNSLHPSSPSFESMDMHADSPGHQFPY
ncbi:uncharacterized protein LOC123211369 [Mangifera indica]|uniref:uncharacterized protein LOC123211369 n=1 Tax=Mangifera indica TaxID=29780 RepID=UPI001CFB5B27|nr:uncharacterized protein LOC123211369 [Mangifera indica]